MLVQTDGLPFAEAPSKEPEAVRPGGIPVKVFVPVSQRFFGGEALIERAFAVGDQKLALCEIYDVVPKGVRARLKIRPERLVRKEGKDIVPDDMLVTPVVEH